MHQYLTGFWSGSSYDSRGVRTDHALHLSPEGSFVWSRSSAGGATDRAEGRWSHGPDEDVLTLHHMAGKNESRVVCWSIQYVTGCEDSNCLLVLRWMALASRNLPILLYRVHPPEDPLWREDSTAPGA